jgi:hypothetical protein
LASDRHIGRLGFGVLLDQTIVTRHVHREDVVAGAQRVELGPTVEVLERIVRPVIGAPAHEALEVAAVVEVFVEELAAGRHVVGEELPLENRPSRRVHAGVDANGAIVNLRGWLGRRARRVYEKTKNTNQKSNRRLHG